jgi:uncharacterized protein
MTALQQPLLIAVQDIASEETALVETNCLVDLNKCLLVASGDTSSNNNARCFESSVYQRADLYIDYLTQGFYVVFNPLSSFGVVIVNQTGLALLNSFCEPRRLDVSISGSDLQHELYIINRFIELGLLESIENPTQMKRHDAQTLTAWLHVTNNCNLRCSYCYVHKTPDAMDIERGRESIDAVFRSAIAYNFQRVKLKFGGGEATMNASVMFAMHDYARYLSNKHSIELDSVLLSNGIALTNRIINELKLREMRVMISLDGIEKYHNALRPLVNGCGSFIYVERALDRLAACGLTPSISITISRQNLVGLPEVVDYVLKRKLPFTLNFYRENDCSSSRDDLSYRDEEVIIYLKKTFAVITENLPPYSLLGTLLDLARLDTLHDRTCGVGQSYMAINQNGGVSKCHMELNNIVSDINATNPLQYIREDRIGLQNPSVEEKEGCRDCTWRYQCTGGCPALTYRFTGRFDIKSPNCNIYKAMFPEVLRLEGLRMLKYSGTVDV